MTHSGGPPFLLTLIGRSMMKPLKFRPEGLVLLALIVIVAALTLAIELLP